MPKVSSDDQGWEVREEKKFWYTNIYLFSGLLEGLISGPQPVK